MFRIEEVYTLKMESEPFSETSSNFFLQSLHFVEEKEKIL